MSFMKKDAFIAPRKAEQSRPTGERGSLDRHPGRAGGVKGEAFPIAPDVPEIGEIVEHGGEKYKVVGRRGRELMIQEVAKPGKNGQPAVPGHTKTVVVAQVNRVGVDTRQPSDDKTSPTSKPVGEAVEPGENQFQTQAGKVGPASVREPDGYPNQGVPRRDPKPR